MKTSKGEWEVKESQIVYQNPWITVTEDQVVRPDGKDGIVGVVTMKPGVSVIAIDDENNCYLTKEYHYAIEKEILSAVSGGIERGDDVLTAAKRELQEELGITADEWIDLGYIDPFTMIVNSPNHLFLARKLQFGKTKQDGTENISLVKLPYEEVLQKVMKSEITHGGTVALILKAQGHVKV